MHHSLLLLRHGETEWNAASRLQGRGDSPLTARGEAAADAMAAWCAARGVQRVVASPLGRAQATAGRIAARCGVEVETAEALVEMDFGACSGRTMREIADAFPGLAVAREAARWTTPWPEGESYADVEARMREWWRQSPVPFGTPPVAVVGHGAAQRALRRVLTAESPEQVLVRMLSGTMLWEVTEHGACIEHDALAAGPPLSRSGPATDARR